MRIESEVFRGLGLEKGQTVPTDVVMRLMGEPDPYRAWTALLGFCKQLQRWLRLEGYAANVKVVEDGVRWLTDAEGIHQNRGRMRTSQRRLFLAVEGFANVCGAGLTPKERDVLDKSQRVAAAKLLAVRRVSALELVRPTPASR